MLLISCANLASLMMSAMLARERELQVRAAIGASRTRTASQLVAEALLLSAAGATLGLAVAAWTSTALLAFLPPEQAAAAEHLRFRLDVRAAGFVALLSIATCLLVGLLPALRVPAALGALRTATGTTPPHRARFSRSLLAGQVALCTTLLILARRLHADGSEPAGPGGRISRRAAARRGHRFPGALRRVTARCID